MQCIPCFLLFRTSIKTPFSAHVQFKPTIILFPIQTWIASIPSRHDGPSSILFSSSIFDFCLSVCSPCSCQFTPIPSFLLQSVSASSFLASSFLASSFLDLTILCVPTVPLTPVTAFLCTSQLKVQRWVLHQVQHSAVGRFQREMVHVERNQLQRPRSFQTQLSGAAIAPDTKHNVNVAPNSVQGAPDPGPRRSEADVGAQFRLGHIGSPQTVENRVDDGRSRLLVVENQRTQQGHAHSIDPEVSFV
ncbi:hypothetical protein EJF18_70137 [Clavispora lusitaniae]|uniref:Uncharacterized protein n=1 Tax=Clavispora lusitaniae TaxID=36911 RepID=A0ACD0WS02_CLALS|nr:hypothetical protein EJF14_70137 [Clavispora lusitaniae]QFZ35734.1 hypothetical protein EJF16_70137 [Clavispora lusitaniae]QFZ41416.1 hypothetical protein EJF15_70137 [Clavispora lusitaniae]QFZ47094.1 hypothetical protein EJF18_70137 [Clavispora lusitaniae]QFZ52771.1 hypothetical protein EJF17_70137 [Clavispora lusitaniae]